MTSPGRNWAGNIEYQARVLHRPTTVEELRVLVRRSDRIHAVGTRHSFSRVADTSGDLVALDALTVPPELDSSAGTVRIHAGMRYGELTQFLHERGWALPNLGSLPHIAVGGACSTGTHGGGDQNAALATAVSALSLVTATGEVLELRRSDPEFAGAVIALGGLGVVAQLTLDLVPAYEMRQWVYRDLPNESLQAHLDDVLASSYSVSVFTTWTGATAQQLWVKRRAPVDDAPASWLGAVLADRPMHPVPGVDPAHCTQQLGVVGPWHERLPHFRIEFTPSHGDELQSEYLLPRELGAQAVAAMLTIGPQIAPALQVAEIRSIATDNLWLSPGYGRPSLGLHFTWRPDAEAVDAALQVLEDALLPLDARPHWGKVFRAPPTPAMYERWHDFVQLRKDLDPTNKFGNEYLDSTVALR